MNETKETTLTKEDRMRYALQSLVTDAFKMLTEYKEISLALVVSIGDNVIKVYPSDGRIIPTMETK